MMNESDRLLTALVAWADHAGIVRFDGPWRDARLHLSAASGSAESVGAELLPCPFCGSAAIKGWCRIHCSKCPAIMHDPHDDERAHIAAWNARPSAAGRAEPTCAHDWVDGQNEVVSGCIYVCTKCHAISLTRPESAARADGGERDGLVARLREAEADYTIAWGSGELYEEAADAIEALQRERQTLRNIAVTADEKREQAEADAARKEKALAELVDAEDAISASVVPAYTPRQYYAWAAARAALTP